MLRFLLACALTLLVPFAQASSPVGVMVGDTEIRIARPDGYARLSTTAPAMFATTSAAMPPSVRLAESLLSESDLKRMLTGQNAALPFLQVQVMRDSEAISFSAKDWTELQPVMAKQFGAMDLGAAAKGVQDGAGERMSKASGATTELNFGEIGKPQVYSQEGGVIRFTARIPINVKVNGAATQVLLDCAGAILVLKSKLLFFNAYAMDDAAAESGALARSFLETAIDQAQVLNAEQGEAANP